MAEPNVLDKSLRSVFVGNIPYEATEEKLKDIFNEVGPVISFKLVYDRESGKPKGYGFCEYKDQETALSAMRNLNCYEIGGRALRVDNACTEKSRLEMQSLLMGLPTSESYYGNAVCAEKAPNVINNVVLALPPEQLYELMKQMKDCVQNNPVEARNMLLQNPQLSYALLQAQVAMKIVEPEEAKTMLYPANTLPVHIGPSNGSTLKVQQLPQNPIDNIQWRKPYPQLAQSHSQSGWLHMSGMSYRLPFNSHTPTFNESHQPFLDSQTSVLNVENQNFMNSRPNNTCIPILPPMSVPPPIIHPTIPPELPLNIQPLGQVQQSQPSKMDSEQSSLILQVMQLTEEQIATLPLDKRESIIQLKEKIIFSSQNKI